MPITFHNADIKFSLRNRIALRKFIENQIREQIPKNPNSKFQINLSFVFCSDEYLLNINRQFLNHDYYTDIITFPLSLNTRNLEAEIYISVERVKENSAKYEIPLPLKGFQGKRQTAVTRHPSPVTYIPELHRVMFHGVLHLLGYKDKTKTQKLEMRKMEDKWLKRFEKSSHADPLTP